MSVYRASNIGRVLRTIYRANLIFSLANKRQYDACRIQYFLLGSFFFLLSACTSIQSIPDNIEDEQFVSGCNIIEHARCMYLTAIETTEDGLYNKWTRHWFRMSYIGKACERQYGRTVAVIIETIFAIPHYAFIAFGNVFSSIMSPLIPDERKYMVDEKLSTESLSVDI